MKVSFATVFLLFLMMNACETSQSSESSAVSLQKIEQEIQKSSEVIAEESGPVTIFEDPTAIYQLFVTDQHPWPKDGSQLLGPESLTREYVPPLAEGVLGKNLYAYVTHFGALSTQTPFVSGSFIVSKENAIILKSDNLTIINQLIQDRDEMYQVGEGFLSFKIPFESGPGLYEVEVSLRDHSRNQLFTLTHIVKIITEDELRQRRITQTFPTSIKGNSFTCDLLLFSDHTVVSRLMSPFPLEQANEIIKNSQAPKLSLGDVLHGTILIRPDSGEQRDLRARVTFRLYDPKGREMAKLEQADLFQHAIEEDSNTSFLSRQVMAIQTSSSFLKGDYLITAEILGVDVPATQILGKRVTIR